MSIWIVPDDRKVRVRFIEIEVKGGERIVPNPDASFIQVATATGSHLFPFRTEKLNLSAPMVLHSVVGE